MDNKVNMYFRPRRPPPIGYFLSAASQWASEEIAEDPMITGFVSDTAVSLRSKETKGDKGHLKWQGKPDSNAVIISMIAVENEIN